ncbi:hypothetical protein LTR17_009879 [Elasticomyces elasticus]|nr:hypothetical protein LTR17_009879 [Elasticomyces elasticus]
MRLVNTQTLSLELFTEPLPATTPYAILSHTWGDEEVTFRDMGDLSVARSRAGFAKIEKACRMAYEHGLQYAWVDTCCIDKSSSAELSEAINSMYRWYQDALLCFAYLADLPIENQPGPPDRQTFSKCRWFTRGWTLQELIAPAHLLFYDREWNLRGTKDELAGEIEAITGVDQWVLTCAAPLSTIPLGKRMSWAASRHTTRTEDEAYCLLGIFEVNMPMIYGEGSKAFLRLQEEILGRTTDLSLLAWQAEANVAHRGILAGSPSEFHACSNIVSSEDQFRFRGEIVTTNRGVKIETALQYSGLDVYILDLHCYRQEADGRQTRMGIYLKRAQDTYFRRMPQETAQAVPLPGSSNRHIFLASTMDHERIEAMITRDTSQRISISFPKENARHEVSDIRAVPEVYWEAHERYFSPSGLSRFTCFVRFRVTSRAPPVNPNHGSDSEESTQFILVVDLVSAVAIVMSLYAETGVQSSLRPHGFIDPFKDIEKYGPLGDAFSLSVLSPGDHEDRSVSMILRDHRNNYVISASLEPRQPHAPHRIAVTIDQRNQYGTPQQYYRPAINTTPPRDYASSAAASQRYPYYR